MNPQIGDIWEWTWHRGEKEAIVLISCRSACVWTAYSITYGKIGDWSFYDSITNKWRKLS